MTSHTHTEPSNYISSERFKDRVVLISGGGGGLGSAATKRLAAEGATVLATDLQAPTHLVGIGENGVGENGTGHETSGSIDAYSLNVTEPQQWAEVVDNIFSKYGRLDGLLMAHGVLGPEVELEEVSFDDWRRTLSINLDACFLGIQAVIGQMKRQGYGRIAALSSIAGREGNASQSPYSASKAGLIALVKAVAKEVAPHGVVVNSIAPSMFQTSMIDNLDPERRAMLLSRVPMGRTGYPSEFASMAAWLLSEECSYTSGQTFDLSGGRYSGA